MKKEIEDVKKKLNKGYEELNEENDSEEESKSHGREAGKEQEEEQPLTDRNHQANDDDEGRSPNENTQAGQNDRSAKCDSKAEGTNYDIDGPRENSHRSGRREEDSLANAQAEELRHKLIQEQEILKKQQEEMEKERQSQEEAARRAREQEASARKEQDRQKQIEHSIQKEKKKQEIKKELRYVFMAARVPYQDLETEVVDKRELADGKVSLEYLKMRLSREPLSIYDEKKLEFILDLVREESGEDKPTYSVQEVIQPLKALVGPYKLQTEGESATRMNSLSKVDIFN